MPTELLGATALPVVIADFQYYLDRARHEIEPLQVDVFEAYGEIITLRAGGREWPLPIAGGLPVGYYLWSPEGSAHLCCGVKSDRDLVSVVREYPEEPRIGPGSALRPCQRLDG